MRSKVIKEFPSLKKSLLVEHSVAENADVPTQHRELVLARIKDARENPKKMLDWDEACKMLKP